MSIEDKIKERLIQIKVELAKNIKKENRYWYTDLKVNFNISNLKHERRSLKKLLKIEKL